MRIMPRSSYVILKYLLFFYSLIFCNQVIAQVNNISGIVVSDTARLSGAAIYNFKINARTISDIRGEFSISARKGDTLITKMFNYKTDTLVVNNKNFIIIKLKQVSQMLREVIIKDTALSPLEKYNQNKKEYKDIYWKGDESKMISIPLIIGQGIGLNLSIDKLYNALSKQGKDARRLQRTLTKDYKNSVVDQHFNRRLVGRITGYQGKKLDDFIVKYRPSYGFVSKASQYDIILYIKKELALDLKIMKKE